MPVGIDNFNIIEDEVKKDIKNNFDSSQQDRIKKAIPKIERNVVTFGRQPRLHSEYKKIEKIDSYTIYRKWVGSSLARFFLR